MVCKFLESFYLLNLSFKFFILHTEICFENEYKNFYFLKLITILLKQNINHSGYFILMLNLIYLVYYTFNYWINLKDKPEIIELFIKNKLNTILLFRYFWFKIKLRIRFQMEKNLFWYEIRIGNNATNFFAPNTKKFEKNKFNGKFEKISWDNTGKNWFNFNRETLDSKVIIFYFTA